ncbi:MAG: hypothetical protein ACOYNN_15230 [Terrimicrobiaceae bacterium]
MADSVASSTGTMLIQIVIVILGLVGLYYLYTYLFTSSTASFVAISKKSDAATVGGTTGIPIPKNSMPPIYQGGEFSISTWINITNWGYHNGINKSIIRIGGPTYDTVRIYLGGNAAQLMVRFDTRSSTTDTANMLLNTDNTFSKTATNFVPLTVATMPGSTAGSNGCDVLQMDMQRWVCLVVTVNGMTADVYMDGKLVRSCLLNNYVNVETGYNAKILDNGGFGGYISTTAIYGQALTPDIVYQMYMAGPEPVTNIMDYLTSFFSPSAAY